MRKKSEKVNNFINGLHSYIINHAHWRQKPTKKTEAEIQAEIRPIIVSYLTNYFRDEGRKDPEKLANDSFYWEGQEGKYGGKRSLVFATRNYPDFIITKPYLVAVEYKKSDNGSLVKQGIGQSLVHTLCGDYDYVYLLFQDQTEDKRIKATYNGKSEKLIVEQIKKSFNVFLKIE